MKIQELAIIFAIIILPVIIILSYYIHREIDTIALQTAYDTKLIDATHDAMASFELNTANEDLSSVSDALRSIIEASNNTFFNSLVTNLGMSNANKSYIQSYIPAILYTLYDGYYIYSPTRVPEVLVGKKSDTSISATDTTPSGDELLRVGDTGIIRTGISAEGNGLYRYTGNSSDKVDYVDLSDETKYEYGQILYKNADGTYSTNLNDNTYYKQDYVLKSYMPYSARYKGKTGSTDYDLTVNYTLDNYITIVGTIGKIYYSKTGYLIGNNIVSQARADGEDLLSYNEIDAEKICLSGTKVLTIYVNPYLEDGINRTADSITYNYSPYTDVETGNVLSYLEQKEKLSKLKEKVENYYNEYRMSSDVTEKEALLNEISIVNVDIQDLELSIENLSAITYYVKSQIFSNWVYNNLGNGTDSGFKLEIKEKNIQDNLADLYKENYTTDLSEDLPTFHHIFDSENIIFDINKNPEYKESVFAEHKFDVIKNSIQYNLNLALSVYDEMVKQMDIKMPVITDSEWESIINNVSIVSFMQGLNCGLKYYNNYSIVSSTNNELTVIPTEIYYTKKEEYNTGDEKHTYHRIDCPEFVVNDNELISFRSKEVKYDKIYDKNSQKYKYDHKNLACYNCIVNSNYSKRLNNITESTPVEGYSNDIIISSLSANKKKQYYKAIGNTRYNVYKTNALTDSNGYQILLDRGKSPSSRSLEAGEDWKWAPFDSQKINKIKALEFSFKEISSFDVDASALELNIKLNDSINVGNITLNLQNAPQTIELPIHIEKNETINGITFQPNIKTQLTLLNIKAIYE